MTQEVNLVLPRSIQHRLGLIPIPRPWALLLDPLW